MKQVKHANRTVKLKAHSLPVKPVLKGNKSSGKSSVLVKKVTSNSVNGKNSKAIPSWIQSLPGVNSTTPAENTIPTEAPSHFRDANTNVTVITVVKNYYIVKHSKNVKL